MSSRTTPAVTSSAPGGIDEASAFVDTEVEVASPEGHDLLVEVRAVSVNPVDTKVRNGLGPDDAPTVLGFDAAGVVVEVGAAVEAFAVGDEVYYAGSIARPGSNAGLQLVDERITGHKPTTLDFAEAAALPLTAITAWEVLFEKLRAEAGSTGTLLVMGAAGGVGSMLVQLARRLTSMTVVAAASRPESRAYAEELGAHHVVDRSDLLAEVRRVAPDGVDAVFSPYSAGMVETYAELMAVRGQVVAIDEPEGLDTLALKDKSQSWHWELMFTVPLALPESRAHSQLLDRVAALIDDGTLRTTLRERMGPRDAATLREAHRRLESGQTIGKVVVAD